MKFNLKAARRSPLARKIRRAIGATDNEPVVCVTPQFEREAGAVIQRPVPLSFAAMRLMGPEGLRELGCRAWSEPENGHVLMLLPGEWYRHIPRGTVLTDINGERVVFEPGETDDDIRFGCLAYGILAHLPRTTP